MWPDPEAASRGSFTDCVAPTHWPFSTRTRGVAPETPDRISFGDRRPKYGSWVAATRSALGSTGTAAASTVRIPFPRANIWASSSFSKTSHRLGDPVDFPRLMDAPEEAKVCVSPTATTPNTTNTGQCLVGPFLPNGRRELSADYYDPLSPADRTTTAAAMDYGTMTAAPWIRPCRSASSAASASSSAKSSTSVRTGTVGASSRNSRASRRVRLATERTARSPHKRP